MDLPSNRKFVLLFISGLFVSFVEPIYLLITGSSIAGALWPMALRSLDWTFFLREWRSELFGTILILTAIIFTKCRDRSNLEKIIATVFLGIISGYMLVFILLDIAYLRGGFILLPTVYGFLILYCSLIIGGLPNNPFKQQNKKLNRVVHIGFVLIAVWLIGPGMSAMAGLSPSPPELNMKSGQYSVETSIHEYPMPKEVSDIQGDYEEDVTFSVYLSVPKGVEKDIPLAIILHGFAYPFFDSYEDWINELSSRGMAVAFIQYPSDVMPPGHDTYDLHEEAGMSNHPYHLPRAVAIYAALEFMITILPSNVNNENLMIAGHSLGAGYALLTLDWALENGWASRTLFVDLEMPYARPVQDHLQINITGVPENFLAHVAIGEDDMSVDDCFGVHHHALLGNNSLFIEVPSDRYGFPRLVASHYLPASETHDTLADWGFYRRVASQADWLVARLDGDVDVEQTAYDNLIDSPELRNMGEWSDGKAVEELRVWKDPLNSSKFEHCKNWTGP